MGRTKTIHTPPPEEMYKITFPGARIYEINRVDPVSATAKFRCKLSKKSLETLFVHMGWQIPADNQPLDKFDGKLSGGHFILKPSLDEDTRLKLKSKNGDVDTDAEIDIEYATITGFACHRMEIEGRKGKGYRRELRFTVAACNDRRGGDFAANIESYMMRTDNAPGSLSVTYMKEPEQTNLDVEASEEQRQAVMEL